MDTKYTRKDINEYTHELNITIPADSFKHSYDLMLQDYSKDLDVKGFRKGKVPADFISLSLIHISEPTRLLSISYAVFCLKKKNTRRLMSLQHSKM